MSEELCIRWYQFGSLLPLLRVTADRTPNQFTRFGQRIMHAALRRRFSLLEYLNTLLLLEDAPYLRPMFYHYEEAANYAQSNECSRSHQHQRDGRCVCHTVSSIRALFPSHAPTHADTHTHRHTYERASRLERAKFVTDRLAHWLAVWRCTRAILKGTL